MEPEAGGIMKIAVNTLFLIPGEVGGSETYLRETLRAVARDFPDIELAVVTNRENDTSLRAWLAGCPQCTFHRMPLRASNRYARILAEQCWLPFFVRTIRPDVLWSPGYTMPFWAPCRQVVSILDMQYRSHPEDLTPLARWTTHLLVRMASRRADRILTISHFSKQEIIRHTGCPPDRIAVTHLGVDPAFAANDEGQRTKDKPYILCVANSYPHKNVPVLVEAFGLLANEIPHRLMLVGKPRLGEAALQRALARVPSDRVHRPAGLSPDELVQAYREADCFVFPSLYEGFGLPVLEALRAGTPVVTTGEGALAEVGGDHVIRADGRDPCDVADKIRGVLAYTPSERATRIRAAADYAASFTWSATAAGTVAAWRASEHRVLPSSNACHAGSRSVREGGHERKRKHGTGNGRDG